MVVVIRGTTEPLRRSFSFSVSACCHGAILIWVAVVPALRAPEPSLYDQVIRPEENHIVWYNLRERLPDVTPSDRKEARPARARIRFDQTLVASAKRPTPVRQMILSPAPEIEMRHELPSPNILAFAPEPRPVRSFTPPKTSRPALVSPVLPVPPEAARVPVTPAAPKELAIARLAAPLLRTFIAPEVKRPVAEKTVLAPAPELSTVTTPAGAPVDLSKMVAEPKPVRLFNPPQPATERVRVARLASPPQIQDRTSSLAEALPAVLETGPQAKPEFRRFVPPAKSAAPRAAPTPLPAAPAPVAQQPTVASLAIVGLNPMKNVRVPKPEGSHPAEFSAAPQVRPEGGEPATSARIVVPGLLARGSPRNEPPPLIAALSPTSHQNLVAALHQAEQSPTPRPTGPLHISPSPDPRMNGRLVYTLAIQMPNVTSFSGSWTVWFVEHAPVPGAPPPDMRPPKALRKVDPKYIRSAVDEGVQGDVRLAAVIRQDGHVDSITLLQHLDDRLDRSAEEALGKWIFSPALRNGVPIDVDAVFQIPFRLAPLSKQ
ncbi:MAG TPA: TonB family protein [Bryobacteraceae bacterium]|nr:TonB family protein [Bryobacteraceae bacterium]